MEYANKQANKQKAFTLIELSIVVVIIGLIVAGVVAGQSLVRQAKFRMLVQDIQTYQSAMVQFKLQYNDIPGDMVNFSSYFSGEPNGDGNKRIGENTESNYYWRHLALVGLISGDYSGAIGVCNAATCPKEPFGQNARFSIRYDVNIDWVGPDLVVNSNVFQFGGETAGIANAEAYTGAEMFNVDTKIDDGYPDRGKLYGSENGVDGCDDGAAIGSKQYNLTGSVIACLGQMHTMIDS